MKPFFFGESSAPLFGIHHEPDPSAARERGGVVLCAPFGRESIRAYRTFRQLALQLARGGFHVLRFDYRGAGDSAGDTAIASPSAWLDDIDIAVDELCDLAGLRVVSLLGLRLGATLALQASARNHRARELVLWQPILRGADYLDELDRTHASRLGKTGRQSRDAADAPREALGFALSPTWITEMRAIDAASFAPTRATRALVLEHREDATASTSIADLRARLEASHCATTVDVTAAPHIWGERELEALVPADVLRTIETWLSEVTSV